MKRLGWGAALARVADGPVPVPASTARRPFRSAAPALRPDARLAAVFGAPAHAVRLAIVGRLAEGGCAVGILRRRTP